VFGLFFLLALLSAYNQHLSYVSLSRLQQQVISHLIEQIPSHQAKRIIIVDESRYLIPQIFPRVHHMPIAVNNIYGNNVWTWICVLSKQPHQAYNQCEIQTSRLILTSPEQPSVNYDLRTMLIFRYTMQHELVLVDDLNEWLSIQTELYHPSE
jgi:hypothetical protein